MRAARPVRALGVSANRFLTPASRAPARLSRFASTDSTTQRVQTKTARFNVITIDAPWGPETVPVPWLRDHCPQSRSPTSGNKSFATSEIPVNIDIESAKPTADGGLEVTWKGDIARFQGTGHVSTFTGEQLRKILVRGNTDLSMTMEDPEDDASSIIPPLFWDRLTLEGRVLRVPYADWVAGGDVFYRAVAELQLTGLVFVTDVPPTQEAVADLGLAFGALQETFYGRTWDVKSKPDAENVAYTSEYLGLHSDMLYLASPPRLQFLHCLENEAEGGESLFSDGGRAARELRLFFPKHAMNLENQLITYHYHANGFSYQQKRPVIDVQKPTSPLTWDLIRPWWSPPFQAPFQAPPISVGGDKPDNGRFIAWLRGTRKLQSLIEDPESVHRHRLQPGECAVFDNTRVLHGRTAFDPATGPRHLRGAYVHEDDWRSTLRRVPAAIKAEVSGDAFGPRNSSELFDTLRYIKYRTRATHQVAPPPTGADQDNRTPEQRHKDKEQKFVRKASLSVKKKSSSGEKKPSALRILRYPVSHPDTGDKSA